MTYKTPDKYFFKIHHIRSRFKNNVENVLIYIATEISKIDRQSKTAFDELVDEAIKNFPGNITKKPKTICNWRTEISSLFGFYQTDGIDSWKGRRSVELSERQDLIYTFKIFLYHFQYRGGHIKPHETLKFIHSGISFHPARYILRFLRFIEKEEGKRESINKAELTHCIFNDLRVTRDNEDLKETWNRIKKNRENRVEYDWTGDVVRYAGDILDYMEIANLLISHANKFYQNLSEKTTITKFINSKPWFSSYDRYIGRTDTTINEIKSIQAKWFEYVNQEISDTFFQTDILAIIARDNEEYKLLKRKAREQFKDRVDADQTVKTKEIGDHGENLVYGHECMRLTQIGRPDLVHLVKCIPSSFAVGYDISSREKDERFRYIEVKTTISRKPLDFTRFHLTPNEWSAAESNGERYYVYRLSLSKGETKLFLIHDPVGKYKGNKLKMIPRNGADISFDTTKCGRFEDLLEWIK